MGFGDVDVSNLFSGLFDLNRDGMLDLAEQTYQLDYLEREMREDNDLDDDEEDDDLDELDLDELEFMDEDERREALEEAGYDSDDFEDEF